MTDKRAGTRESHAAETPQASPDPLHGLENLTASDTPARPVSRPETADMQAFIGRQLRAVFDDVAKQPIPDRFIELMKQIDAKPAER